MRVVRPHPANHSTRKHNCAVTLAGSWRSPLNRIEFDLIKCHPEVGYEILKPLQFPWPIADMVRQHHEKMDGSGYPLGLRGEEILPESRILVVADVVEAIVSHRPYRPALGIERALEEVEKNRGILYDAEVVESCSRLFKEKGFQMENSGHGG
ncbi:MAG: HD-GYP domain-containing protein [Thermodesulfobacteriota bacterium]